MKELVPTMSIPSLFNGIFNDFFNDSWLTYKEIENQDPANYYLDDETGEYVINAQIPGFAKEEINIEVDENGLKFSGELKNDDIKKKIGNKKFSYLMKVKNIDDKSIDASLENGILEIRFKKKENKKILKKIEIK